ncbi:hypothetical protein [Halarcobacter bivalviorum]|uniref:hypothetical protein n=1 Tax=Halarcobacter bivalviorum TaxID=663364 RepID=UPI00100BB5DD|nr:hypothetical protein [Halarcobacter bivalviorum]RXK08182.1 hypothetical protein CRU97_02210 [Halarcobacter bivalviorum]
MELLLFVLIVALFAFLFFFFADKTKNKEYRSTALKKEELIQKYEDEMLEIIEKYKEDSSLLTTKKIEYLKKASNQLHNNIFFTEKEAKALIQRLASF